MGFVCVWNATTAFIEENSFKTRNRYFQIKPENTTTKTQKRKGLKNYLSNTKKLTFGFTLFLKFVIF
jgi:hypothetical protein